MTLEAALAALFHINITSQVASEQLKLRQSSYKVYLCLLAAALQ